MKQWRILLIALTLLSPLILASSEDSRMVKPLYFESPEQAVDEIRKLLLAEDWNKLAQYYQLPSTPLSYDEIATATFFVSPWFGHPGFREKYIYRHPFNPSYSYLRHEVAGNGRIRVILSRQDAQGKRDGRVAIPQGEGMPDQVGIFPDQEFQMIKTDAGYQIIPPLADHRELIDDPKVQ